MISMYASKYRPIPVMVLCTSFPSLYLTPDMSRGLPDAGATCRTKHISACYRSRSIPLACSNGSVSSAGCLLSLNELQKTPI